MADVVDLAARRPPALYSVHFTERGDGELEFWLGGLANDAQGRARAAAAMRCAADSLDPPESPRAPPVAPFWPWQAWCSVWLAACGLNPPD